MNISTPTAKPPAAPLRPFSFHDLNLEHQADLLRRRLGISLALAIALAPLIFGTLDR